MKILRIALSVALFATFHTTIIRTNQPPADSQISQQEADFITKSLFAVVSMIQKLDHIIGDLAILVNRHQIKNISSPDHILRVLTEYRQRLGEIVQSIGIAKTPDMQLQVTAVLLQICDEIIPYIEKGVDSNLKDIQLFDISKMTKRNINLESMTPQSLQKMIEDVYQRVEGLKIKASKAGLTWYNLAARSFDKNFVTTWNKYHGTSVVTGIGGATLLTSYMIMRYGKSIDNPTIQAIHSYLTDKFGVFLDRTAQGKLIPTGQAELQENDTNTNNGKPYNKTLLSLLEFSFTDTASGHVPIAMFAGTALWSFYTNTWKNSISPWIHQQQSLAWNYLRGGSYLNAETPGFFAVEPKVNFDHMVGLDEVKEEFKILLEYLDEPEKFLRSGTQPETGWILTGPPRTGKSFSFECLCGEIVRMQKRKGAKPNFTFFKIGIEEIAKVGIQTILGYAKENAPMIIFVDEIDLLGLQRVGDNKLLHDFLTALQSTQTEDPSKIVIVMAATNSPETLDKALRQYGRLGKEIRFEAPSFKYRKEFLIKELSGMALNPHSFDINSIVARTNGKTYEELKAILRKAMTRAWAQGIPLTQGLIDESIDTEINKIIIHDRKELPEHEKRILASHFAGQALATILLDTHAKLDLITIKAIMTEIREITAWYAVSQDKRDAQQKIIHGGLFTKYMHDTIELKSEADTLNDVKVLLAGFIAEEIILGSSGMQCHPEDNDKAYKIIDQMIFKGINPNELAKSVREKLRTKAYELLQQCQAEVKELLEENRDALDAVVQGLMEHGLLSDNEVKAIIEKIKK